MWSNIYFRVNILYSYGSHLLWHFLSFQAVQCMNLIYFVKLCRPSWLVDSNRIATKIRSASGASDLQQVNWTSNPTKTCPNCQHVIDNSDVYFFSHKFLHISKWMCIILSGTSFSSSCFLIRNTNLLLEISFWEWLIEKKDYHI